MFVRLGNRPGSEKKTFGQDVGLNYKFNVLGAGLGISQIGKLPETLEHRRKNATAWFENLAPYGECLTPFFLETESNRPSFYSVIFLLDPELADITCAKQVAAKLAQVGFKTDIYKYDFKLMPEYPVFQKHGARQSNISVTDQFPNAASVLKRMLVLPTHSAITEEVVIDACNRIICTLPKKYFERTPEPLIHPRLLTT